MLLEQLLTLAIGVVVSYGAFHRALGWPLQPAPDSQAGSAARATGQEILARKVWSHRSGLWNILADFEGTTRSNTHFI